MSEIAPINVISEQRAPEKGIIADPFQAAFDQLLMMEYEKTFKATVQILEVLDAMLETLINRMTDASHMGTQRRE